MNPVEANTVAKNWKTGESVYDAFKQFLAVFSARKLLLHENVRVLHNVAVWLSGNALVLINEIYLCRAQLRTLYLDG